MFYCYLGVARLTDRKVTAIEMVVCYARRFEEKDTWAWGGGHPGNEGNPWVGQEVEGDL